MSSYHNLIEAVLVGVLPILVLVHLKMWIPLVIYFVAIGFLFVVVLAAMYSVRKNKGG